MRRERKDITRVKDYPAGILTTVKPPLKPPNDDQIFRGSIFIQIQLLQRDKNLGMDQDGNMFM